MKQYQYYHVAELAWVVPMCCPLLFSPLPQGVCDGMTYAEIAQKFPEDYEARKRDKLRYRYPSGESYLDVVQRLEPVIIEMEREREYICVVGHQVGFAKGL
jgi:broad specificity phosphatase PhoE